MAIRCLCEPLMSPDEINTVERHRPAVTLSTRQTVDPPQSPKITGLKKNIDNVLTHFQCELRDSVLFSFSKKSKVSGTVPFPSTAACHLLASFLPSQDCARKALYMALHKFSSTQNELRLVTIQ